ncbi:hypothetical protein CYMTET_44249 [Cymbomonas tetramitiformis]|uniref:Uncharacterized protein n=1 Tax=Cymbomonas tetramitiformis TaxID=36881 RepID=A0AAE0C0N6_9CHLO|nr:hypothetical protein CYMTET_44249 [Cymbomonas tetramitiformis]
MYAELLQTAGTPEFATCALRIQKVVTLPTRAVRVVTYAQRKVYVHHYTQYMDECCFSEASETVDALIGDYAALDTSTTPGSTVTKMQPVGVMT